MANEPDDIDRTIDFLRDPSSFDYLRDWDDAALHKRTADKFYDLSASAGEILFQELKRRTFRKRILKGPHDLQLQINATLNLELPNETPRVNAAQYALLSKHFKNAAVTDRKFLKGLESLKVHRINRLIARAEQQTERAQARMYRAVGKKIAKRYSRTKGLQGVAVVTHTQGETLMRHFGRAGFDQETSMRKILDLRRADMELILRDATSTTPCTNGKTHSGVEAPSATSHPEHQSQRQPQSQDPSMTHLHQTAVATQAMADASEDTLQATGDNHDKSKERSDKKNVKKEKKQRRAARKAARLADLEDSLAHDQETRPITVPEQPTAKAIEAHTHRRPHEPPSRPRDKAARTDKKRKRRQGRGKGSQKRAKRFNAGSQSQSAEDPSPASIGEGPLSPPPTSDAQYLEYPAFEEHQPASVSTSNQLPSFTSPTAHESYADRTQLPASSSSPQPSLLASQTIIPNSTGQQQPPSSSQPSLLASETMVPSTTGQQQLPRSSQSLLLEPQTNDYTSIRQQRPLASSQSSLLLSQADDQTRMSQQQQPQSSVHPPPRAADFDSAHFCLTGRERFRCGSHDDVFSTPLGSRTPVHDYSAAATVTYPALPNASALNVPHSSLTDTGTSQGRYRPTRIFRRCTPGSLFDARYEQHPTQSRTPSPASSEDELMFYTPMTRVDDANRTAEEQPALPEPPGHTASLPPPLDPPRRPPPFSTTQPALLYPLLSFNNSTPSAINSKPPAAIVEELPQSEAQMPPQPPSRPPSPRVVIVSPSKEKRKLYRFINDNDDTEDEDVHMDPMPPSLLPIEQTPYRHKRLKSALTSFDKSSSKRKSVRFTGATSRYFSSPTPSPQKPRLPAGTSCLPFADISDVQFGLIQENLWAEPYNLLLALIFLNRTKGISSIGIFYELKGAYPEAKDLANADPGVVEGMIKHLGFGAQRTKTVITLSQEWLENEPRKGYRYRRLHYPTHESGKDIKPHDVLDDDDPRDGAWEVAHLRGIGPYAIDSWRIFCRDALRGLAMGYNGEGAMEGFEPEWKRVLPLDKELRAYLRWMWLKEGWDWEPLTGNRQPMMVNDAIVQAEKEKLRNWIEEPSPQSTPRKRKLDADVVDESAPMPPVIEKENLGDMTNLYDGNDWIPPSAQRPRLEPVVVIENPRTSPVKEQPHVLPTGDGRVATVAASADEYHLTIASNEQKISQWLDEVPAASQPDNGSSALAPASGDAVGDDLDGDPHVQDADAERAKAREERKEQKRKRKRDKHHFERKLTVREPTEEELAIFREKHGREWDGGLNPNADWVRQHK